VADTEQLRLAEVVGALSLATDVGMGAPLELGPGTCLVASRLADELGCTPAEHSGVLATPESDVPPTGRTVEMTFALFVSGDPAAGEASRVALYMDQFAMAAQLGMLPEPQATGATA
jgi:hypothetical protein